MSVFLRGLKFNVKFSNNLLNLEYLRASLAKRRWKGKKLFLSARRLFIDLRLIIVPFLHVLHNGNSFFDAELFLRYTLVPSVV